MLRNIPVHSEAYKKLKDVTAADAGAKRKSFEDNAKAVVLRLNINYLLMKLGGKPQPKCN
jgi:hypothetical protein